MAELTLIRRIIGYFKMEQKVKTEVIIVAMGCITSLMIIAMLKGMDGVLLTTVIAVLAGLAGLIYPTPKILK